MPAIITNDLRIANGDYFQNDVSDIPTYIYFGGTTAWNDPARYGVLCYDEWEGGNRYGVRYEELLAFIISAM